MKAVRVIPVICLSVVVFTSGYLKPQLPAVSDDTLMCGAKIPPRPAARLDEMNAQLRNARQVCLAGRERLIITGSDRITREYMLKNGVLWSNSDPLVGEVRFFYFEYRDRFGNLILRPARKREEIKSIAYILAFKADPGIIKTHFSTNNQTVLSGALAMNF